MQIFHLEEKVIDTATGKEGVIKEFLKTGLFVKVRIDGYDEILRFTQLKKQDGGTGNRKL